MERARSARAWHALRHVLAALVGLAAAACSCAPEPTGPATTVKLLARQPDAILQQPGVLLPQGDVPGAATWGESEGPGWSQKAHTLADGTPYLETNQHTAALRLEAARPVDRELELALWCAQPALTEPGVLRVHLNGAEFPSPPQPGRNPGILRLHAPAEMWVSGDNVLELEVPLLEHEQQHIWDTLALARVSYGPSALVTLDPAHESARLVDGTGLRYELELAAACQLTVAGKVKGAGTLIITSGTMDPRTGERSTDADGSHETTMSGDPSSETKFGETLPLTHRPGALRTLELEWRAPAGGELTLTRLECAERGTPTRPPIVFVSIDTFAARHLSLYGYARRTSPALEEFQKDALVFERCLANAPWTLPSYLSVMSGLYPRAHTVGLDSQPGAEIDVFDWWQLADNRWTLAEALRARGYRTGAFVDTQWLSRIFGLQQGFDVYNGEGALAPFSDPTKHIRHLVEDLVPAWLPPAPGGEPYFLFVHALDAHGPYWPDAPFFDRFAASLPEERTLLPAGSANETYRTIPTWMARSLLSPEERALVLADEKSHPVPSELPLEELVERYDEALLKVDTYLGKLFESLRARGLYDEAVIVVTGDHGEAFGPSSYGHGVMREDVLHVPLLVKLPHGKHAGERVTRPVALVDVYPTLLELAGIEVDPARLQGTSLLRTLASGADSAERPLYSEGGHVEQYALTLGRWRLVEEWPGRESSEQSLLTHPRVPEDWLRANFPELLTRPLSDELMAELHARPDSAAKIAALRALVAGPYYTLHDLQDDPQERVDLSAAKPEVVARLKPLLEAEKERSRRARADAHNDLTHPRLSDEAREKLGQLGYGQTPDEKDEKK